MEELKTSWDLASNFSGGDISERWWGIILAKYSEDGRVYHNHTYLNQLFELFYKYEEKFKNSQAISLAIFFHKLYFNPRSGDGELQSLEQFKKFMKEADYEDSSLYSDIYALLEASTSNLTEAHMKKGQFGSEDVHYFVDFIVAILGSSPDEYNQYTTKIQAEYSHLSSLSYRNLRLRTLKSFLLIPNVYATKEFQEERENQARINIQTEIEKLSE